MNNLIIALATALAATVILLSQRTSLAKIQNGNTRLALQISEARANAGQLEQRRDDLQSQLAESRQRLRIGRLEHVEPSTPAAPPETTVPPDPTHQGGWPEKTQYFYLPKKNLASVGFTLFDGNQLTSDAVTLFGMTPGERSAVENAYQEMQTKLRALEKDRLEKAELPEQWRDSAMAKRLYDSVSYRIPALGRESDELKSHFQSKLQRVLGATRVEYLADPLNAHLAARFDDLGANARTISFARLRQQDHDSLVYSIVTEGGSGSLRTIQEPLPGDSREAYYARLLGVNVSIEGQ